VCCDVCVNSKKNGSKQNNIAYDKTEMQINKSVKTFCNCELVENVEVI
jgi:hypothetical protein